MKDRLSLKGDTYCQINDAQSRIRFFMFSLLLS
jgi:hypothetical protein